MRSVRQFQIYQESGIGTHDTDSMPPLWGVRHDGRGDKGGGGRVDLDMRHASLCLDSFFSDRLYLTSLCAYLVVGSAPLHVVAEDDCRRLCRRVIDGGHRLASDVNRGIKHSISKFVMN